MSFLCMEDAGSLNLESHMGTLLGTQTPETSREGGGPHGFRSSPNSRSRSQTTSRLECRRVPNSWEPLEERPKQTDRGASSP